MTGYRMILRESIRAALVFGVDSRGTTADRRRALHRFSRALRG